MNNKLSIDKKEDIPNIISEIANIHGVDSAKLVLDGLVENYNPDLLIEILRTKIKEKNEKSNSSFIIGLEVYLEMYIDEIKQKSAIARISDRYGIKENTVKTHIDNFRKLIRNEAKFDTKYGLNAEGITDLINDFVKTLYDKYYGYDSFNDITQYFEPDRKEEAYKRDCK